MPFLALISVLAYLDHYLSAPGVPPLYSIFNRTAGLAALWLLGWHDDDFDDDFALVRASVGDRHGNLVFDKSTRNFNPLVAMAGRITVAEVEQLVEPGEIKPDQVHIPGVFVQRVVPLSPEQASEKRIERRTVSAPKES